MTRTRRGRETSRPWCREKSQEFSPGNASGRFPGELLGVLPRTIPGKRAAVSSKRPPHRCCKAPVGFASFLAASTMIVAGPILMGASPPRPLTDEGGRGGSRPDEAGQQVTDFSGGQGNDGGSRHGSWGGRWRRKRTVLVHSDAHQESRSQHDEGEMAIPAEVAAHFILIESQVFAGLQVLLNAPAGANGLHDGGQRRVQRSKDQVVGELVGVVKATAHDQEVATVHAASLEPGQDGP